MQKGYVLFSGEEGIYLGSCMGMGFWTFLDPVGQDAAVVFPTKEEAMKHVDEIYQDEKEKIQLVEVDNDKDGYASIRSCVRAGLPMWNPNGNGIYEEVKES